VGDVAVANGFTVTINQSVTVQELRNDTTGSATAGGRFALSSGLVARVEYYVQIAQSLGVVVLCFWESDSIYPLLDHALKE
jgi:hypothetical protein